MTKVSVLMSVYNGEAYLREAVDSVLSQTERDIELVVVNDGSTDATDAIIRSYTDPRIRYLNLPHQGRVPALNAGIAACGGQFVAILDADDICMPDRLEKQIAAMSVGGLALCGSWAETVGEDSLAVGTMTYPPVGERRIRLYSLAHNPFIHSTIMIRRDALVSVGGYRPFRYGVEDYELWTRIIYRYKVDNLPEKLVKYRIHSAQTTRRVNYQMRLNALRVRLLAWARFASSLLG